MPTTPVLRGEAGAPEEAGTMPIIQGAPAEAGPAAGRPHRNVVESYSARDDVGCVSIYQGNWVGNRSALMQKHVDADIAEGAPCHIVTAQEVDPNFVNRMQSVTESGQLTWHVVALDPEDHKTCIIAARRSWATEVRVLERHVTNDGEYKVKGGKNSN
jgi:hypothetical protein